MLAVKAFPSMAQVTSIRHSSNFLKWNLELRQFLYEIRSIDKFFIQYSAGKAAREAFFRALAVEEPNLRILNYSPGPVQTDMHEEIAERSAIIYEL